ncbi:hypothetical protein PIROE2DRAFT_4130 [Piromyces sp. E2]|nr:hypothetical protein PIROE2DRAFT_4130 [Piromyces sp. E2]|eukprot:OUM68250.1 hypothetical protein PIROE2DRAFT_4130 [Piromyces sp. E2]
MRNFMHFLLDFGHIKIVKYLIQINEKQKAKNNKSNIQDNLPLLWASYNGHLEIVKFLLSFSENHMHKIIGPIIEADYNGHIEILKYILNFKNVNISTQDNDVFIYLSLNVNSNFMNNEVLIQVCKFGQLKYIKYLNEENGLIPSLQNNQPIIISSEYGHYYIVKYLLIIEDVDLSACESKILYFTVYRQNKLLLSFKNVSINDYDNMTFIWACQYGHYNLIKNLLSSMIKTI